MMKTENDSCNIDNYNWDELSVGNLHLNHSNNFFVKKHPEHEKFYKMDLENHEDFGNEPIETNGSAKSVSAETKPLVETHKENIMLPPPVDVKSEAAESPNKIKSENASPHRKLRAKPIESKKPEREFNVVKYAKIYDGKKKAAMDAIDQKERAQRLFHSKPAPNFHAIHAAVECKRHQQPSKVTCPSTPSVLRRHTEKQAKLQKQREEYEASLRPKPFLANADPDVLRKPAFKPQREKCYIVPAPFNLHSDARLKQRKIFDEQFKSESERRQQEKEEQQKRDEETTRKELRKATEFKAQPNPFK